jgi:hypothetical protein
MLTLAFVGPGRTSSLCPNVVQRNISLASSVMVEPTTAQLEKILAFDFGTPVDVAFLLCVYRPRGA